MRNYILLISFSLFVFSNAMPAEITVKKIRGNSILIQGEIVPGDYVKFIKEVLNAGTGRGTVMISTPGGDVAEAIKIGRLIRRLRFSTEVPRNWPNDPPSCPIMSGLDSCECASACLLIYAGGIYRYGDLIGIHRSFLPEQVMDELSFGDVEAETKLAITEIEDYLVEMGSPRSLIDRINTISSSEIEYLPANFVEQYLTGYLPIYDEWLKVNCGDAGALLDLARIERDEAKKTKLNEEMSEVISCQIFRIMGLREESFTAVIIDAIDSDKDASNDAYLQKMLAMYPFDIGVLTGKTLSEMRPYLKLMGFGWVTSEKIVEPSSEQAEQGYLKNMSWIHFGGYETLGGDTTDNFWITFENGIAQGVHVIFVDIENGEKVNTHTMPMDYNSYRAPQVYGYRGQIFPDVKMEDGTLALQKALGDPSYCLKAWESELGQFRYYYADGQPYDYKFFAEPDGALRWLEVSKESDYEATFWEEVKWWFEELMLAFDDYEPGVECLQ